jgi:hypothetical protein
MPGGNFLQDGNGGARLGVPGYIRQHRTRKFLMSFEAVLQERIVLTITGGISASLPEVDRVCYLKGSLTKTAVQTRPSMSIAGNNRITEQPSQPASGRADLAPPS